VYKGDILKKPVLGISLTGGGARGAYQAGVLQGIAQILDKHQIDCEFPFKVYSGISAGSINATFCASSSLPFVQTTKKLCDLWLNIKHSDVYNVGIVSIGKIGLKWIGDISTGGLFKNNNISELLDPRPLQFYLSKHIDFTNIKKNIKSKRLNALACSSFNYSDGKINVFVQSNGSYTPWNKIKRKSIETEITKKHILASSAIPIIFPSVKIKSEFFGDGSLKNSAPLSPLIHLNVDKAIVIDVQFSMPKKFELHKKPRMGRIFGTILNALFYDSLDNDLERVSQISKIANYKTTKKSSTDFRELKTVLIRPSEDPSLLSLDDNEDKLPRIISYMISGLGDPYESSELSSYLHFCAGYSKKLIALGLKDSLSHEKEIVALFKK
jgi:NTE family protein